MLILLHFTTFQQQIMPILLSIIIPTMLIHFELWSNVWATFRPLQVRQAIYGLYTKVKVWWSMGAQGIEYLHDRFDVNSLQSKTYMINNRSRLSWSWYIVFYIFWWVRVFFQNIDQNHWWYKYRIKREAFLSMKGES